MTHAQTSYGESANGLASLRQPGMTISGKVGGRTSKTSRPHSWKPNERGFLWLQGGGQGRP